MAKLGDMTNQKKPLKRLKGIKNDKIALKKLSLIVQPDTIWLNSLT